MIAQILEAAMLLCFGLSWPTNAYKNYQARTAAGTSWQFILLITVGYFAGIAAKVASGSINWVLAIYLLNLAFLAVNWGVYFRNRELDAQRIAHGTQKTADELHHDSLLKKVIFATDGSDPSVRAAVFAAKSLDLEDANVKVLACYPEAKSKERAQAAAQKTADALEKNGIRATCITVCGNAAAEIVSSASDNHANLLVMGSRGLTGLRGVLMGSVSRNVSERACCPVLIVR